MIIKFINAAKYAWKNLLWLPVTLWVIGSIVTHEPQPAAAFDAGINGPALFTNVDISTDPVLVSSRTNVIDLYDQQINKLSAQLVMSTVAIPAISFTDGAASTATITIASNTALAAATSWITVTVGSNSALGGATAYVVIVISSNSALDKAQLTLTLSTSPFEILYSSFSGAPYVAYSTPLPASGQIEPSSYTFVEGRDWYRSGGVINRGVDFASQTAVNIANALNFSTYGVTASTGFLGMPPYISTGSNSQNGIVIVMAKSYGKYANIFSLQSSTQFAMTVCYSTSSPGLPPGNIQFASTPTAFTGGRDPAFLTVTTTATFTYVAGRDFTVDPFVQGSSGTAQSLSLAIRQSSASAFGMYATTATMFGTANAFQNQFSSAIYSPSVVIIQAASPGTFANSWTAVSSSQSALTVSYSTGQNGNPIPAFTVGRSSALAFNGGLDPVLLKVNGIPLLNGRDWFTGSVASATAMSISSAIAFNVRLGSTNVIASTASMFTSGYAIVYCTSAVINHNEYNLYSSSNFALVISTDPAGSVYADGSSTGSFKGGFDTQFDTPTLSISTGSGVNYKFLAVGAAVVFSTTTGQTPPGALTFGTTYFVTQVVLTTPSAKLSPVAISSSVPLTRAFTLAHTSTGAFAGIAWTTGLSTRNAQGGNTYTLTPIVFQTACTISWKFSNDGKNWMTVNGASNTISNVTLPNSTTYYDFGLMQGNTSGGVNYRYLREDISASSNTPVSVRTNIFGKY